MPLASPRAGPSWTTKLKFVSHQIADDAMAVQIPFNVPPITDRELDYLRDAIERRELAGNGHYTRLCTSGSNLTLGTLA